MNTAKRLTIGCLTGLMGLACLGLAVPAFSASRVFSDGFEAGNAALWTKNGQRDLCSVVKTSVDGVSPHSGTYMAECNWDGTVAWNAPNAYSTLSYPKWNFSKEFFIRVWVRAANDCSRSWGAKLLRLYPATGTTDELFLQFQFNSPGGPIFSQWILNGVQQPAFYGPSSLPLGDGAWHKLEIYVRANDVGAANGEVKLWQDGNVMQDLANTVTNDPTVGWSGLYLMSNWSNNGPAWAHGANNHVDWDDVEIYTDQGTGAIGAMADASIGTSPASAAKTDSTKPNAPSGVAVH